MNDKHWRWIQEQSDEDILGMVMDYTHGRKIASDLMDKINKHCQLSFAAGVKEVSEDLVNHLTLLFLIKAKDGDTNAMNVISHLVDRTQTRLKEWGIK